MNVPPTLLRRRRDGAGFTLIEVLISILIFSLGVLGTIALQARAAQFATQNGDRSRASLLANEMVSTMWAAQTISPSNSVVSSWQTMVATPTVSGLPNGAGSIATSASSATITITWKAPSAATSAASASYSTTVVIQ
jgi:type IV pilus assembly protein PilV